mmetsp:Transcript_65632/g.140306  ORF Transcript_65632/g.140306 Transcript_65632/m.140306 type:complete len:251 (+) Transcript_65632:2845-3597(+)
MASMHFWEKFENTFALWLSVPQDLTSIFRSWMVVKTCDSVGKCWRILRRSTREISQTRPGALASRVALPVSSRPSRLASPQCCPASKRPVQTPSTETSTTPVSKRRKDVLGSPCLRRMSPVRTGQLLHMQESLATNDCAQEAKRQHRMSSSSIKSESKVGLSAFRLSRSPPSMRTILIFFATLTNLRLASLCEATLAFISVQMEVLAISGPAAGACSLSATFCTGCSMWEFLMASSRFPRSVSAGNWYFF